MTKKEKFNPHHNTNILNSDDVHDSEVSAKKFVRDTNEINEVISKIFDERNSLISSNKFGKDKVNDEKNSLLSRSYTEELRGRSILLSIPKEYERLFPNEWYVQIFRLKGWPIPENGIIKHKPHIVGAYTKQLIYHRFYPPIINDLEIINPYNPQIKGRKYKHFQYLSDSDVSKVKSFISESLSLMKSSTNWHEFIRRHAEFYGHPYQLQIPNFLYPEV